MKSPYNFCCVYDDGAVVDLHDMGLWVQQFRILSPRVILDKEEIDGMHGALIVDRKLGEREIRVQIDIEGNSTVDFDLLRDEVYTVFSPLRDFYIIRDINPHKRYRVTVVNEIEIDFAEGSLADGSFLLTLVMHQPYAESLATSQTIKTWTADKWFWGSGLRWDEDLQYTFTTNQFVVNNIGQAHINPREHMLKIDIIAIAQSHLRIENQTTGDIFQYHQALTSSDTLTIDGTTYTKNNKNAITETNFMLLSLAPGKNQFTVTGGTIQRVSFDFRFLLL